MPIALLRTHAPIATATKNNKEDGFIDVMFIHLSFVYFRIDWRVLIGPLPEMRGRWNVGSGACGLAARGWRGRAAVFDWAALQGRGATSPGACLCTKPQLGHIMLNC